jgi:hypothetical protein
VRLARVIVALTLGACSPASNSREEIDRASSPVCGTAATDATRGIYEGLKAECAGCHLTGSRGYFASLGAFQELLVSDARLVKPGDPDQSELVKLLLGTGTGAFRQMPIAGAPYAQRPPGTGASLQDVRAWVNTLSTQRRDDRPNPDAPSVARLSAAQIQRTLYLQLGLGFDDFSTPANEFSLPMAEQRNPGLLPMQGGDAVPGPRQVDSAQRFQGLGGGTTLRQVRADLSITPTWSLTLQQVAQSWCRIALTKPGNTALFAAGSQPPVDAAGAKQLITRWGRHFLGVTLTSAEVDAVHQEVFTPLVSGADATTAWTGVCSYFIRHPLWNVY